MKQFNLIVDYNDTNNHPSWQKGAVYYSTDCEDQLISIIEDIKKRDIFDINRMIVTHRRVPGVTYPASTWL